MFITFTSFDLLTGFTLIRMCSAWMRWYLQEQYTYLAKLFTATIHLIHRMVSQRVSLKLSSHELRRQKLYGNLVFHITYIKCYFDICGIRRFIFDDYNIIFSCDQAALQMVFSVCLSVCPSVRPSVCPSVTPFSPCSHHRIIMIYSGVITMVKSDVHAKGQGQRSTVKVKEVNTQLSRFRTLTPVWIHIWQWNHAHSWKQHRRGVLLSFKVIRQISRSHGSKNCRIWPRLGVSGL